MSEVVDTAAVAEIAIITVVAQTQAEEEVVMEAVAETEMLQVTI